MPAGSDIRRYRHRSHRDSAIFALNGFAIGHIMRQISADLACRAEEIAGGIIRGNTAGTCSPVGVQSRIIMLRGGGGVAADGGGRAVSHTDKSAGIAHTITGSMNGGRVVAVFQRNFVVRPAHDAAVAVHIFFKRASDGAVVGAADDLVSIPIHIAHNAAHTGRTGANGKTPPWSCSFQWYFFCSWLPQRYRSRGSHHNSPASPLPWPAMRIFLTVAFFMSSNKPT